MLLHLPLFETVIRQLAQGQPIAVCAVIKTRGSTPQSPGAMLAVDSGLNTVGTLGGGCVEAEVCKRALELLNTGESRLLSFQLDRDYGWDDGLICGGGMDVAITPLARPEDAEQFKRAIDAMDEGRDAKIRFRVNRGEALEEYDLLVETEPKLVIAGAGHIGAKLADLCVQLEFAVTVLDDRHDFANPKRLPPPIQLVVADIEQSLQAMEIDRDTYVVIVTRGHRHDEQALAAVIQSDAKYIGMIGSRRKVKLIFDDLASSGIESNRLKRVRAPIGLSINAVTVPEIAMSIAGELISVRRAHQHRLVEGPRIVPAEGSTTPPNP